MPFKGELINLIQLGSSLLVMGCYFTGHYVNTQVILKIQMTFKIKYTVKNHILNHTIFSQFSALTNEASDITLQKLIYLLPLHNTDLFVSKTVQLIYQKKNPNLMLNPLERCGVGHAAVILNHIPTWTGTKNICVAFSSLELKYWTDTALSAINQI